MGECQGAADAKHCVSCHNSRIIIYTTLAVWPLKWPRPPFEDVGNRRRSEDEFSKEKRSLDLWLFLIHCANSWDIFMEAKLHRFIDAKKWMVSWQIRFSVIEKSNDIDFKPWPKYTQPLISIPLLQLSLCLTPLGGLSLPWVMWTGILDLSSIAEALRYSGQTSPIPLVSIYTYRGMGRGREHGRHCLIIAWGCNTCERWRAVWSCMHTQDLRAAISSINNTGPVLGEREIKK